jgi:hypothetical protein
MDIGDGFYGVGLGFSLLMVVAAQLMAVTLQTVGLFVGRRLRIGLTLAAALLFVLAHAAIALEGVDWWRKVFLGNAPGLDRAWLASGYDHSGDVPVGVLVFHAVCHLYTGVCLALAFRPGPRHLKSDSRQAVSSEV